MSSSSTRCSAPSIPRTSVSRKHSRSRATWARRAPISRTSRTRTFTPTSRPSCSLAGSFPRSTVSRYASTEIHETRLRGENSMIHLDYTNMLAPAVKGGIPARSWSAADKLFARAHKAFEKRRGNGELGFLDLPRDAALHAQSTDFVKRTRGKFDDVVVLGIGGSALGPIALRTALRKPLWNLLPAGERDVRPRLHVLDNVDPSTIAA